MSKQQGCTCSHTQALIVKEIVVSIEDKIDKLANALGYVYQYERTVPAKYAKMKSTK